MSQLSGAHGFWFRRVDPMPARERVRKAVIELTRARRLQLLVDHAFGGLLAGLGLATVAVLAVRLASLPASPWQLAGAVTIVVLALALLVGWWRRPATLDVAIRADLALKLKQRLSTAWEFMTAQGDQELSERLAVQALGAGLPARAGMVFPLRLGRWGGLAPLAAVALVLVSVIDFKRVQGPAPRALDERVASEGRRLGAFGRAMQERAARDKLPRSGRQGGELERLGARMEAGAMSRRQALGELGQLRESLARERMQARAEASRSESGLPPAPNEKDSPDAAHLNPQAMLDRLQRGGLDSADAGALSRYLDELPRSGTPHQELEKAMRRHRDGADDALKQILENLARTDRARKEDRELARAEEQLRRSQENLDEALAMRRRGRGPGAAIDWDEDDNENAGIRAGEIASDKGRHDSDAARAASRSATQGKAGIATDPTRAPEVPDPKRSGPVLQPEGQTREGESFTSQGRILPRAVRPSVENVEIAREFAPQVEEVLSREQYPAHYKELVRRYFLTLSQGARSPQQGSAAGGQP
jgi:uncharacterized membrane protein YqjE